MAVSVAGFLDKYPEFDEINDVIPSTVTRAVDDAKLLVSAKEWGKLYEIAVYCTAAHSLAVGPFGENARLDAKSGDTIYSRELRRLQKRLPRRVLVV